MHFQNSALLLVGFCLLLLLPNQDLSGQSAEVKGAINFLHAEWDMDEAPSGYPALLVLRQEGNKFPAYWAGRYEGESDPFVIKPIYDVLDGALTITSEGRFNIRLTQTSPRPGMEDRIPAGAWMHDPAGRGLQIRFLDFTGWNCPPEGESLDVEELQATATFRAEFMVEGHQVSLQGESRFQFDEKTGAFNLISRAVLPGAEVGLRGEQAKPIELTLYLRSPIPQPLATVEPDLSLEKNDGVDFPGL
ncbi:MAG: hypothetical protein ACLFS1_02245 [Opitutales bacterium]